MKVYHKKTGKNDHETPQGLYEFYDETFGFRLDAAAVGQTSKCARFISPHVDALKTEWITRCQRGSSVWLNPPYDELERFVRRAITQARRHDLTVVMLMPSRTGSRWFTHYVAKYASEIRFINSRICFDGMSAGAGFPSVIIVFKSAVPKNGPKLYFDNLTPQQRGFMPKMKKGVGGAKSTGTSKIKKSAVEPTKKATVYKQPKKAPSEIKGETQFKNTVNERKIPIKPKKANKKL